MPVRLILPADSGQHAMSADTTDSTKPTAMLPTGQIVPPANAKQPEIVPESTPVLLDFVKKLWSNIKAGNFGNRLAVVIIFGALAIFGAFWFLGRSSLQNDSAMWSSYELARDDISLQSFADQPNFAKSEAGKLAALGLQRDKANRAIGGLGSTVLAERKKALGDAIDARGELEKQADLFKNDRSIQTSILLQAADLELALIGIRSEKADALEFVQKPEAGSVGKVAKYVELLKKAATVIGVNNTAGRGFTAQADKAEKAPEAMYKTGTRLYGEFYREDDKARPNPLEMFGPGGFGGGER